MSEKLITQRVTVSNAQGLHARPAHLLVQTASRFQSRIELIKQGDRADAKSILSVLTLAAVEGTTLRIEACGDDAERAVQALTELFEQGFAEEDRPEQCSPDRTQEG